MPIRLGDTEIADLRLGDASVDAVYLGDTLIWPTNVPYSFTPDHRPIYLNNYAISTAFADWGVDTATWRNTGTTGNNTTAAANGRRRFIENGGFQDAAGSGIARYIISNTGGLTNFGPSWAADAAAQTAQGTSGETAAFGVKGYNCNSFSTMQSQYVRDYRNINRDSDGARAGGNGDGTATTDWNATPGVGAGEWLPSPFTSDGTTTGTFGDSVDAWQRALEILDGFASGLSNVQKIHQWDWPAVYADSVDTSSTTSPPVRDGTYDRLSASTDFQATTGALRWVSPDATNGFDRGFWDYEVNGITSLGFNGYTWGVSGNTWQDYGDTDGAVQEVWDAYQKTFLFEAIPMTSTGTGAAKVFHAYGTTWDLANETLSGEPDQRYEIVGQWGFFPSYFTTEQYSTDADSNGWNSNGGRWIDNIWFNPAVSEMHCIFDYGYLVRQASDAPQYAIDGTTNLPHDLTDLMIMAWQHGFVVGVSNLTRSGGNTPTENGAICDFLVDLNTVASTASGIETSTATNPRDGSEIKRYEDPATQRAIPPSETILDTYTQNGGQIWRAGNVWWNVLQNGTWSSTGTNQGTYLALDSGSSIRPDYILFSNLDPGGWPANARVRVTFTPSTGGPNYAVEGAPTGAGDSRWYWDDGAGNTVTLAVADFEEGGNWGWNSTDTLTIEIYTP